MDGMDETLEIINELIRVAVKARQEGKHHVFVEYAAHVDWITVRVHRPDNDYSAHESSIYGATVTIGEDDRERVTSRLRGVLADVQKIL